MVRVTNPQAASQSQTQSRLQFQGKIASTWRQLAELVEPRNRFFVGGKYGGKDTKAPFAWGKILEKIRAKGEYS